MVIRITIKGLRRYLIDLPKKLDRELTSTNEQFMKDVKRSAKLRAPSDTRKTKDSIDIEKTKTKGKMKQWKLVVDSRAAIFQELGFKPHWAYIKDSRKLKEGLYFVSKSKPFIIPAFDSQLSKLDQKLNRALDKSIK